VIWWLPAANAVTSYSVAMRECRRARQDSIAGLDARLASRLGWWKMGINTKTIFGIAL
jgi:hypothetical protein